MDNTSLNNWHNEFGLASRFVFQVFTPVGSGTGFLVFNSKNGLLCGIATAYHVIAHAFEWEELIKVKHYQSEKMTTLPRDKRAILVKPEKDLALVLFNKEREFPVDALSLIPPKKFMKAGVQIGWCGFPAVSPQDLCFFSGYVSGYLKNEELYLIDGVAINGVSGGPAFIKGPSNSIYVGGVVSAYKPNAQSGIFLPGVSIVSSVEPFQQDIKDLTDLDDARAKEEDLKPEIPSPSPPPPEEPERKEN